MCTLVVGLLASYLSSTAGELRQRDDLICTYDSLHRVLREHQRIGRSDASTVMLMNEMALYGANRSFQILVDYTARAATRAREINDRTVEAFALLSEAVIMAGKYGSDSALPRLQAARSLLSASRSRRLMTMYHILMQNILDERSKYFEAVQQADSAIIEAQQAGDPWSLVLSENSAAWAYSRIKNDDVARLHLDHALKAAAKTTSAELNGTAYFSAHTLHADSVTRMWYLEQSNRLVRQFNLRANEGALLLNHAIQLMMRGDGHQALEYAHLALKTAEEFGVPAQVLYAITTVARTAGSVGDDEQALAYAFRAFDLTRSYKHVEIRISMAEVISKVLAARGQYKRATAYFDTLTTLLAQSRDPEGAVKIAAYQIENATQQQRSEIALLERDRAADATARWFLIGIIGMTSTGGLAMFRLYRKKRRANEEIERQRATLATQSVELESALQRSDSLLLNVLPVSIAERLKAGETSIVDHFDSVSILFLDIADFSRLSTQVPATELVNLLNRIFTQCDTVVARHGLEKIKTIGDAYMAVCGAPTRRADHAVHAALAALDILDVLTIHHPGITVRIGLHCGPAIGGVIGEQKFAYDLWGDTVNLAARMEQHGEPGRIHISDAFAEELQRTGTGLQTTLRGMTTVKGMGSLTTYWLTR